MNLQHLDISIVVFGINILVLAIAIGRYHEKQSARIDLLQKDVDNNAEKHASLETRLEANEQRNETKLDRIENAINEVREMVFRMGGN